MKWPDSKDSISQCLSLFSLLESLVDVELFIELSECFDSNTRSVSGRKSSLHLTDLNFKNQLQVDLKIWRFIYLNGENPVKGRKRECFAEIKRMPVMQILKVVQLLVLYPHTGELKTRKPNFHNLRILTLRKQRTSPSKNCQRRKTVLLYDLQDNYPFLLSEWPKRM